MNDVTRPPPPQDPEDIDDQYRRASAADPNRPKSAVRQAVLAHAAKVAAERKPGSNAFLSWLKGLSRGWSGPALVGTLAAAAFAGMMILPRVQMLHQAREAMEAPKRVQAPPPREPVIVETQPAEDLADVPLASENAPAPLPAPSPAPSLAAAPPASAPLAPPLASPPASALKKQQAPEATSEERKSVRTGETVEGGMAAGQAQEFGRSATDGAAKPPPAPAEVTVTAQRRRESVQNTPTAITSIDSQALESRQDSAPTRDSAGAAAAPAQDSAAERSAAAPTAGLAAAPQAATHNNSSNALQEVVVTGSQITRAQVRRDKDFWRAAEKGDLPKLQSLLAQGVIVNAQDAKGRSALLLAVQHKHLDIVNALLENEADPNLPDNKGVTPLKAALDSGQTDLAETLRQHGAQ